MDFYPLTRTAEQINSDAVRWRRIAKFTAIGAMACIATMNLSFSFFDTNVSHFVSDKTQEETDDGEFIIITANIRNKHRYAAGLMSTNNSDLGLFQETSKNNIKGLVNSLASSEADFAPSDYAVDWQNGGQGNTTVSIGLEPTHDMRQFYNSVNVGRWLNGLWALDKRAMANAYKERRSAIISSFDAKISGLDVPVNIMNIHIAGGNEGKRQLDEALEFAESEMDEAGSINIISGDLNQAPGQIRPKFGKLNKPWVVANIGATSRDSGSQIDHFIYQPVVIIDGQHYKVSPKINIDDTKGSDHRAIVTTLNLKPIYDLKDIVAE